MASRVAAEAETASAPQAANDEPAIGAVSVIEADVEVEEDAPKAKAPRKRAKPDESFAASGGADDDDGSESGEPRRGWWQRTFGP